MEDHEKNGTGFQNPEKGSDCGCSWDSGFQANPQTATGNCKEGMLCVRFISQL